MTSQDKPLIKRTMTSLVALSLVIGMTPACALALDEGASNATTPSPATTEGDGNANTGGGETTPKPSESPDTPATSDKPAPTTPSSDDKTNKETRQEERSDEDEDPYASTYVASNANIGSSTGSVAYLLADSPTSAAARQALAGWDDTDTVIIAPSDADAEILCASALAGTLECPLLLTGDDGLDEETKGAIKSLGATKAIIVTTKKGDAIARTEASLATIGTDDDPSSVQVQDIRIIKGRDASELSLAVALFGQDANLWKTPCLTIANGSDTEVARATTGFAYRMAQPVLLTSADGALSELQRLYFDRSRNSFVASEGTTLYLVSKKGQVAKAADSLRLLTTSTLAPCKTISLEGEDACSVNTRTQRWYAGKRQDMEWNGSLLTNPSQSSGATGGVLAARLGVAHLACTATETSSSTDLLSTEGATELVVTGEDTPFETWTINAIRSQCGIIEVTTSPAGISIDAAANREVDYAMDKEGHPTKTKDEVLEGMDPGKASYGSDTFFKFAVLGNGYSGAITAEQLDAFIAANAGPSEASAGTASLLRGQGQSFIDAAKESGVNEVYLLAHAIIESAYGTSPLSRGTITGANNFYGIAAFDSNPNAAASYAASQGWYSPEEGIKGGAAWIAQHYIHASTGQDTIYRMRFNLPSGTNQYATSLTWSSSIASLMSRIYASAGIDREHTGLTFKVTTF